MFFLIIISFITNLFQEFDKILVLTNVYDFNISSSFAFITLSYILYQNSKSAFRNGYLSYDSKVFSLIFIFIFALGNLFIFCFSHYIDFTIDIKYNTVCEVINDRMKRILETSNNKYNMDLFDFLKGSSCNITVVKLFFILLFSFIIASFYRSITRMSYFDVKLINSTNRLEEIEHQLLDSTSNKKASPLNHIKLIIKCKSILAIICLFSLIDPIMLKPLLSILSEYQFVIFFQLPLFSIECIFSVLCLKYYSNIYLNQNYYSMIEFCNEPNQDYLSALKLRMSYINSSFWDVFQNLICLSFMPFLLFIFFINRSGCHLQENINVADFTFKNYFLENVMYVCLLSLMLSKAIIGNLYNYYLQKLETSNKRNVFI